MIKSDFLEQRLVRAIKFIDANFENKLSLDEICKHAGLSKFHFHRLFLVFYDLNIYEYMKALRLREAAVSYTHLDVYKRQANHPINPSSLSYFQDRQANSQSHPQGD